MNDSSAGKVLSVLELVLRHSVHGLTHSDIVQATGLSAPSVSRYVAALEKSGWAERVSETGRIRASVRVARMAVGVMADLDKAQSRLSELRSRISAL